MGEVYKARDTRLDRTVAIKVLPEHVASDPALKQRFEREAKTISSLNHPHICTLYDVGREGATDFLVMEHLEGETLAQRLTKGALSLDQALQTAIQIADALDKAHRQGIVHRDLKPGNIMLTKTGAKLLDFGLAKLRPTSAAGTVGLSEAPTISSPLTGAGTIIGTLSYMAPEQLQGQEADARTDIFAFGAVVYEMVTGKKAFEGKSQASLISAIMSSEPPRISDLQPVSPPTLDYAVTVCLGKDPDDRWQTARDLLRELRRVAAGEAGVSPTVPSSAIPRPAAWRRAVPWAVAAVLGIALVTALLDSPVAPETSGDVAVARTMILLPADEHLVLNGDSYPLAVSPDGARVVYAAERVGQIQLYLRNLDELEVRALPGTTGARNPFFSPDGAWIGFFAAGALQKLALAGGAPLRIADIEGVSKGASWGPDDTIVFATRGFGLFRVPAAGGVPERLQPPDTDPWQRGRPQFPQILPDRETVVFTLGGFAVATVSLGTGAWRILATRTDLPADLQGVAPAVLGAGFILQTRYVPTGHLLYGQAFGVRALPFDLATLSIGGSPISVLESVYEGPNAGAVYFATSNTGVLLYAPGNRRHHLVWVERNGVATPLTPDRQAFRGPTLSPDGARVAVVIDADPDPSDIWVYDVERGTKSRLTTEDHNLAPVWTPDGQRITFYSASNVAWQPADASGPKEFLLDGPVPAGARYPTSWSPDGGDLLLNVDDPATRMDLWLHPVNGGAPQPFLVSPFSERSGKISPNGRWLAYASDESGRDEVYVASYPNLQGRIVVSTEGGAFPSGHEMDESCFFVRAAP